MEFPVSCWSGFQLEFDVRDLGLCGDCKTNLAVTVSTMGLTLRCKVCVLHQSYCLFTRLSNIGLKNGRFGVGSAFAKLGKLSARLPDKLEFAFVLIHAGKNLVV